MNKINPKKITPIFDYTEEENDEFLSVRARKEELQLISLKAKEFQYQKDLQTVINKKVLLDLVLAYLTRLHTFMLDQPNRLAQEVQALALSGASHHKIEKFMMENIESKLIATYNFLKKKADKNYPSLKRNF